MSEQRNDYGFPYSAGHNATDLFNVMHMANQQIARLCGMPHQQTKLERAHAIAAEVRARKFPPVKRITDPKE